MPVKKTKTECILMDGDLLYIAYKFSRKTKEEFTKMLKPSSKKIFKDIAKLYEA